MAVRKIRTTRSRPSGSGSGAKSEAKTEETTKTEEKAETPKAEAKAASAKPAAAKSTGARGSKKPAPNLEERMEGVQGWMAELERKQNRMTKLGGAARLVAILAAAAAIALGVMAQRDSASEDDVDGLRDDVNALSGSIEDQTESQLGGLDAKITTLENQVKSLQQQQQQNAQTIATLQSQAASADGAGAGAGAGTVPPLPDAQQQDQQQRP